MSFCGSSEVAQTFEASKVASFLTSQWEKGASASRVKASLSVLEVTKKILLPESRPLVEHGVVRTLLDAVKVDRPLAKDKRPYYDVSLITEYWSMYISNERLPIAELRRKVISLLAVDLFLRGADLLNFTAEGFTSKGSRFQVQHLAKELQS